MDGAAGPVLPGPASHARKLWLLVEYLIFCGRSSVSAEELTDILWPGETMADDPVCSIRLLVHRARAQLARLGFAGEEDLILCTGGAYSWNRSLPMEIDADIFERNLRSAETECPEEKRLQLLLNAISLYKGHFLPKEASAQWVMAIDAYFHSRYVNMCVEATGLLHRKGRTQEEIGICTAALVQDPYVDQLHVAMVRALTAAGDIRGAKEHYRKAADLFRDELDIDPSPELTEAYHDALKQENMPDADMAAIQETLSPEEQDGAFYCEYEFFRQLYSLKQRECIRGKYEVQLALISAAAKTELASKRLRPVMASLSETIRSSLRQGDVYTRFSSGQYLLLLQFTSTENGAIALSRIRKNFRKAAPSSGYLLKCELLPVLPEKPEPYNPPAAKTGS